MPGQQHVYVGLIDGDESVCRSFSRLLRAENFQAVTYSSAEDFLCDRKHPDYDCLVLEVRLPGISGIELRRRLAGVHDPTPVIYLTDLDEPEARAEALREGCVGFFPKDVASAVLIDAIRRAAAPRNPGWRDSSPDGSSP